MFDTYETGLIAYAAQVDELLSLHRGTDTIDKPLLWADSFTSQILTALTEDDDGCATAPSRLGSRRRRHRRRHHPRRHPRTHPRRHPVRTARRLRRRLRPDHRRAPLCWVGTAAPPAALPRGAWPPTPAPGVGASPGSPFGRAAREACPAGGREIRSPSPLFRSADPPSSPSGNPAPPGRLPLRASRVSLRGRAAPAAFAAPPRWLRQALRAPGPGRKSACRPGRAPGGAHPPGRPGPCRPAQIRFAWETHAPSRQHRRDHRAFRSIGRIEIERFGTHASPLKAYAALLEATTKLGGVAEQRYGHVELFIPKTAKELTEALESEQRRWDSTEALWLRAVRAEDGDELREWERESVVTSWCDAEGKPNRSTLRRRDGTSRIRRDLGLVC